jgi:hypothetical protein
MAFARAAVAKALACQGFVESLPAKVGTLAGILNDVAAHLEISRD